MKVSIRKISDLSFDDEKKKEFWINWLLEKMGHVRNENEQKIKNQQAISENLIKEWKWEIFQDEPEVTKNPLNDTFPLELVQIDYLRDEEYINKLLKYLEMIYKLGTYFIFSNWKTQIILEIKEITNWTLELLLSIFANYPGNFSMIN
jgi:hypothetical protein